VIVPPTIGPTPCVDKNGVYVTKGMTVLYTSPAHTPPYNPVVQEGITVSIPVFVRDVWGEYYWAVSIKGDGWSTEFARVRRIEVVTAERTERGPSDIEVERAAIAAWLRSEPETVKECDGHRHKGGKKCSVIVPMTTEELAAAIERGRAKGNAEERADVLAYLAYAAKFPFTYDKTAPAIIDALRELIQQGHHEGWAKKEKP